MTWQLGVRLVGALLLRLVTTGQFWVGLVGIALVVWLVPCVLRWEAEIVRRLAPLAGFLISLGAMLSGVLLSGLFPQDKKWVAWLIGMCFRFFIPVVALLVILVSRTDRLGELVAIWTGVFYVLMVFISAILAARTPNYSRTV
jgi:hypothetical protein